MKKIVWCTKEIVTQRNHS